MSDGSWPTSENQSERRITASCHVQPVAVVNNAEKAVPMAVAVSDMEFPLFVGNGGRLVRVTAYYPHGYPQKSVASRMP